MKCRVCAKMAVLHITEVLEDGFEQLHFCEECGRSYLYRASETREPEEVLDPGESLEVVTVDEPNPTPCGECGLKFVEFRNSGRLGCPHDYEHFREELLTLLENIQVDTKHVGKVPSRAPNLAQIQGELTGLRKRLQEAVEAEKYEEAAKLRDSIRKLEQA
jgi:protein arginine kinase activator